VAFLLGFRIIAGDAGKRNAFVSPPDIPQSLWGLDKKTPKALTKKAIRFNCLHYSSSAKESLTRYLLLNKSFIDLNCADSLSRSCCRGYMSCELQHSHSGSIL
jgi:hypothetical protein